MSKKPVIHEVIVGNIGCVYRGESLRQAMMDYSEYKNQSKRWYGRAAGEQVVWLKNGEVHKEHIPENAEESDVAGLKEHKFLHISNRHLARPDIQALEDNAVPELLSSSPFRSDWFIHIPEAEEGDYDKDRSTFDALVLKLRELGFSYARISEDGQCIPGFPIYPP